MYYLYKSVKTNIWCPGVHSRTLFENNDLFLVNSAYRHRSHATLIHIIQAPVHFRLCYYSFAIVCACFLFVKLHDKPNSKCSMYKRTKITRLDLRVEGLLYK